MTRRCLASVSERFMDAVYAVMAQLCKRAPGEHRRSLSEAAGVAV